MGKILTTTTVVAALSLMTVCFGQGGGQGGFGGGGGGLGGFGGNARAATQAGFGGMQQGQGQQQTLEEVTRQIEGEISQYLGGEELKSILTPGEFVEYKLDLKAGQVVLSEARSDAFDPALEVVDEKGKVLASNDDRYPGDQRPLLLWHCDHDGSYLLHVRCFHDKSGGQVFVRLRTYDSVDLTSDTKVEKEVHNQVPLLLRIPLKAGQYKKLIADYGTDKDYANFGVSSVISPTGLPNIGLGDPLGIINGVKAILAPVAGDYYVLATPYVGRNVGKIKVGVQEMIPAKLARDAGIASTKGSTNTSNLWEFSAKAGELLKVTGENLNAYSQFVLVEKPDISKYDLSKPETNPFYPHAADAKSEHGPSVITLPGRARDGRVLVVSIRKDSQYWLATEASGPENKQFTLNLKPGDQAFAEDKNYGSKLKLGNSDYWSFEAKAGDVMTFKSGATGFTEAVSVRDPDLNTVSGFTLGTDEDNEHWKMIIQKPGRYLVAVNCMGEGGSGDYTLSRQVVHAKEFGIGAPAQGELADGQVQIWKFTATPDRPLLIHWHSSLFNYGISINDEKGQSSDFQRQWIDDQNQFGILKVVKPQTFVIVLTGVTKASYLIDLEPLVGKVKAVAASRKG